jgi:hypothetical protein
VLGKILKINRKSLLNFFSSYSHHEIREFQGVTARYRAPTTITKYDGETNPSVWLEDYRLACHNVGATNDLFIIKSIPLYLVDSARTCVRW